MKSITLFKPIKSKQQAEAVCGPLSWPSKMPCPSYNLPATACKVGAKLAKVPGSVCHDCYALKGRYRFPNVKASMDRHLASIYHPQWVDALCYLILDARTSYFRWHDSGDLQNAAHLENICEIARRLPQVAFWLPTREKALVGAARHSIPRNLVVRLSQSMVDGPRPSGARNTSTVHRHRDPVGQACPAHTQGNQCGECRACWDPAVENVSYPFH